MIEQMPKYDSYKKSGVEWSNELPEHWEIKKIFHNFYAKKGDRAALLTKEYCDLINGDYPVYSGQTGNDGVMGKIDTYEFDMTDEGCLFSTTVGAKAMTLKYLDSKFSLSQNCMVIINRNKTEVNSKFCFYAFQPLFSFHRKQIPEHMQASFRMEDLYQYKYFLPPISEQVAITLFLDKKTAQIDEAIAIKRKQIELLKERKQIIIQQAVTQGLNPDAPMKDSGVDWIGQIPEHWGGVRFKNLFTQSRLPVRKGDGVVTSYRDGQVTLRSNRRVGGYTEAILEGGYQGIRKGQLVLNSMDAFEGAIGVSDSDGKCTPEYVICDPISSVNVSQYYFAYLLREMALAKYIQVICNAVRQRAVRIRYNNLAPLFMVVPPVKEQEDIVSFIEKESAKLDAGIKHLNEQISKLKEYKTTLINSAVTGKIKVTELA
ncbi:restriction endonuclease subunit S [Vibrio sp. B181a]|uniref:restriction endonuclease subunit S n=1 Tax=Vibrio sp. B181a TaxID=2835906 RepID=UPI002555BF40|nr:restriction endonuclease subunit S [Vibrio sp. B181a]MDK9770914.1 restriction endonuclease subunit S [Vibrio sp. B181a]